MESSDYLTSSRLSLRSSQRSYLFVVLTVNDFVRLEGEYNSLNLMQNLLCPPAGLLRLVFIKKTHLFRQVSIIILKKNDIASLLSLLIDSDFTRNPSKKMIGFSGHEEVKFPPWMF